MKKIISFTLLTLFMGLPNKFYEQLITDAAGVGSTINGKSSFEHLSSSDLYYENKFSYNTYDLWLPIPAFKIGKARVLGIINYRFLDFKFDKGSKEDTHQITKIEEIKPTFIIAYPLEKKWSVFAVLIPTFASDFKNPASISDLIFDGIIGVSKKVSKESNLEIGIAPHILYAFGKILITPAISVDYKSNNDKWIAQLYWPRVNVFRNLGSNTQFGVAGSIDWTLHNVKNYKNQHGTEIDYAQFSAVHCGLQINHRLYSHFWLQLQGGVAFANQYTLYDLDNNSTITYKTKEIPYAKMMLTYRFGK